MTKIDAIVTSCARHDLLDITLSSVFNFMGHNLNRVFVFEDSHFTDSFIDVCGKYPVTTISLGYNVGQVDAIDMLMQNVKSEYYLHLEDDFECISGGFVEDAMAAIEDEKVIQVNGRGRDRVSMNGHPNENGILKKDYHGWTGWCYAPTLNRLKTYEKVISYGNITTWNRVRPYECEKKIGRTVIGNSYCYLTEKKYFNHIGNNRSTIKINL